MTESSRRSFLKTSAVGAATIAGTSGVAIHSVQAQTSNSQTAMALKANEISKKLFVDDGLAIEIAEKPTISKLATGLDRVVSFTAFTKQA
ncbi:MAG: twin-arginine translocation signal domain-containing protein [Burkholderiales bacterium]|nr:twin-arginine translocation signal domain-containing protein [Burkholderiales bacterium]